VDLFIFIYLFLYLFFFLDDSLEHQVDLLQEDFVALLEICAAKGNEAHILHVLDIMQETIYALPPESIEAMSKVPNVYLTCN